MIPCFDNGHCAGIHCFPCMVLVDTCQLPAAPNHDHCSCFSSRASMKACLDSAGNPLLSRWLKLLSRTLHLQGRKLKAIENALSIDQTNYILLVEEQQSLAVQVLDLNICNHRISTIQEGSLQGPLFYTNFVKRQHIPVNNCHL